MSYGIRKDFYNSKAWKIVRKNIWIKQNLLCNRCKKPVYVDGLSEWIPKENRRTGIVHHKIYLDNSNIYEQCCVNLKNTWDAQASHFLFAFLEKYFKTTFMNHINEIRLVRTKVFLNS